jgi:nucleotide-binding universal stress UspA family protein
MLGSVARAVVTTAPCTVQIVRDPEGDRKLTLDSARRVLLASDGSAQSAAAAEGLAARPWPEGSEFRIVTVEEPWLIRPASVIHNVETVERVLVSAGLTATVAALSGNPKEVILEEAKNWNADLIVVGSHGRRGIKRLLLGSVSEAVAMKAPCSVVVVRGSSQRARKK